MAGMLVVPLASAAVFGRPAEIPLAKTPVSVAVTDATQDGVVDVVLVNSSAPILTVLPGRRDGSFERPLGVGAGPVPRVDRGRGLRQRRQRRPRGRGRQ